MRRRINTDNINNAVNFSKNIIEEKDMWKIVVRFIIENLYSSVPVTKHFKDLVDRNIIPPPNIWVNPFIYVFDGMIPTWIGNEIKGAIDTINDESEFICMPLTSSELRKALEGQTNNWKEFKYYIVSPPLRKVFNSNGISMVSLGEITYLPVLNLKHFISMFLLKPGIIKKTYSQVKKH